MMFSSSLNAAKAIMKLPSAKLKLVSSSTISVFRTIEGLRRSANCCSFIRPNESVKIKTIIEQKAPKNVVI